MKVPYPTGFYAKGLDGRIDDPNAAGKAAPYGRQAATAYRGKGHDAHGGAVPDAPRPARRLSGRRRYPEPPTQVRGGS